jgi:formiminotetrahydrofolate cyclodeaminase
MAFADQSIDQFFATVASGALTPSGGAVAAVAGAAGAALCEMACRHTLGGTDADGESDLGAIADALEADRDRLLELADADAAAVEAVFYSTDEGATGIERATEVPLDTAMSSLDVLERAESVTAAANPSAVPDATTGAYLAHAAVRASTTIVQANLAAIDDAAFAATAREQVEELDRGAASSLERVRANADAV